jgi:predicted dinucleotide-binding enzyme
MEVYADMKTIQSQPNLEVKPHYSIAVIGAGKIGQAVGQLWLRAGHSVCFGSRSPEKLSSFIKAAGEKAKAKSIVEAAAEGEIIFLALPYSIVDELVPTLRSHLSGKIVIDATNPFALTPEGRMTSSLGSGVTAGSHMAALLPQSFVIRAFTHVVDEALVSRATTQPGMWAIAIAGDNPAAKKVASKLVSDTGFVPVDIGTLAESSPLDPGGKLFPNNYTAADMRAALRN